MLLELGAVIDARDRQSWTSLHKACNKGHVEVASLLVDRGASLTARDGDGWTPLYVLKFPGKHFCRIFIKYIATNVLQKIAGKLFFFFRIVI